MGSTRTTAVLLAVVGMVGALSGCSEPPGEAYVDTTVQELLAQQPGLYELYSTVENPIDIPTQGENFVVLRQGKHMIIAAGDTLQQKIATVQGQDYSLIGRRMGQPKIWFAVDGIVQDNKLVYRIGHTADKVFPSYEEFDPALVEKYEVVDLNEYDFDKERKIRGELLDKDIRITGILTINELEGGAKQYFVESRNLKVELSPVGPNMRYFLDIAIKEQSPFVGYGQLTSIRDWDDGTDNDRESSQVIGAFNTELYRYSRDIIVRNIMP